MDPVGIQPVCNPSLRFWYAGPLESKTWSHLIFEAGFCITLGLGMDLKFGSLNSWSGPGYKLDPLK